MIPGARAGASQPVVQPGVANSISARLKRAEIASSAGAAILGFGIGALFAARVGDMALPAIILGAAIHGWGMLSKHALERSAGWTGAWWNDVLYRICWIALAVLGIALAARSVF